MRRPVVLRCIHSSPEQLTKSVHPLNCESRESTHLYVRPLVEARNPLRILLKPPKQATAINGPNRGIRVLAVGQSAYQTSDGGVTFVLAKNRLLAENKRLN
jgi:hypothetical protein